ncbi:MAG: hypothetical protein SFT81_07670 [Candidatus Caenarcaniphilales bacterium]|nr:hypothetical protein [Candidatus Caenarcaniphilales bacterium]
MSAVSLGALPVNADITVGGNGTNLNNNENNNIVQPVQQTQIKNFGNVPTGPVSATAGAIVTGSPSAYSHTHLFHGPWNFTPPDILFHPSKTIGDNSVFSCCRIINVGTPLRGNIKDFLFGIYDEREAITSRVGKVKKVKPTGSVIVCGLNTNIPPGCASFIGTGYAYLEEYATTEAALVGLARMAARQGANIVGNVNCAYMETIRTYSTALGGTFGFTNPIDGKDANSTIGGAGAAAWGTSRVKRPAMPHCTGDFYLGNSNGCYYAADTMNQTHFPQPVAYRRYLPPPPAPPPPPPPPANQPVRGLW